MELSRYFAALRRGWKLLLLFSVLGAIGGYAYASSQPALYRSTAAVFFQVVGADNAGSLLQGSNYAQSQVRSYATLATLPLVLDPVIEELSLDLTSAQLARQVQTNVPLDTAIVEITATSQDPQRAQAVANGVARQLEATVEAFSKPDSGPDAEATVNAQLVASGTLPNFPFSPNKRRTTLLGLIVGLGLGAAVALLRELYNNRIPDETTLATVTDVPLLGNIPVAGSSRLQAQPTPAKNRSQVEAFRRLAANMDFINHAGRVRAVVITSATASEGKSTVAVNLAYALSENRRVLLIDGDLRNPSLAERLGLEPNIGLTTVIAGKADLRDVVQHSGRSLDVVTSGLTPPNPTAMISSDAFDDLLAQARQDYDFVVIDGAPLLPVTDSALLAKAADGALLVVNSARTKRAHVARAIEHLRIAGTPMHGAVLTMTPAPSANSGYYGYYGQPRRDVAAAPDQR